MEVEPVGYVGAGAPGENCPGEYADPKAKEGFLCVYTAESAGGSSSTNVPSTFGAFMVYEWSGTSSKAALGSWAVTAG
jgi:hypothetical protein